MENFNVWFIMIVVISNKHKLDGLKLQNSSHHISRGWESKRVRKPLMLVALEISTPFLAMVCDNTQLSLAYGSPFHPSLTSSQDHLSLVPGGPDFRLLREFIIGLRLSFSLTLAFLHLLRCTS